MFGIDLFRRRRPWGDLIEGSTGVGLAFLWGLAEGTLFFIVPDVLISLVALVRPRNAWRHILVAIAGSMLAGIMLFGWSSQSPKSAAHAVAGVPLVNAEMFTQVDQSLRTHGKSAVMLGPLRGIPYKVYAVEAPRFLSEAAFLSITIPARGLRFVLVWGVFGFARIVLQKWSPRTYAQLAAGHACVWFAIYAFYGCVMHYR